MKLKEAIAQRILELCEQRHITVNKLSMICGMTQSTINNIVNSGSKRPTVATVQKICYGLGISLGEFFTSELFLNLEQEYE